MKTSTEKAAGELAEPYQLGVGEVERLRGDLLQAANLELRGNPYIAHRKKQINALCDAAKDKALAYAAALRTPSGARDGVDVIEVRLCESVHLGLRPNQLYRFSVAEGCAECESLAAPYASTASASAREEGE